MHSSVLNSLRNALNAASGVFQELVVGDGETTKRFRLSPYGTFPAEDVDGNIIQQVVDREAAVTMAANFASLTGKLATFFRGIPIYEGHADNPDWAAKNPGHRASAVGRIKAIEPGEDGVYVTCALNSDGVGLLSGEAPRYTGQSPLWRLVPLADRPDHFRPVLLWSVALTNTPNILSNSIALNALAGIEVEVELPSPDETQNTESEDSTETMKLTAEALAALGFAPDATPSPEEISQAILDLLSAKATAEADKVTADGAVTAANSRASAIQTEFDTLRTQAVDTVLGEAIATGRITEAQRPAWTTALNTSFLTEAEKLKALMPVYNTRNQVAGLGERRPALCADAANAASRITDAVREHAAAKAIDITTGPGWDRAYQETRASRPELFAKAEH